MMKTLQQEVEIVLKTVAGGSLNPSLSKHSSRQPDSRPLQGTPTNTRGIFFFFQKAPSKSKDTWVRRGLQCKLCTFTPWFEPRVAEPAALWGSLWGTKLKRNGSGPSRPLQTKLRVLGNSWVSRISEDYITGSDMPSALDLVMRCHKSSNSFTSIHRTSWTWDCLRKILGGREMIEAWAGSARPSPRRS